MLFLKEKNYIDLVKSPEFCFSPMLTLNCRASFVDLEYWTEEKNQAVYGIKFAI